ncbi:MAG: FAD-dependent oxidoreductase [Phycisphaerae bacterium]
MISDRQGVTVTVDGRASTVSAGTTILDAARAMGIAIPTLCHYRGLSPYGACRVCLVEIDGPRGPRLVASCSHPIEEATTVRTNSDAVIQARRTVVQLLLAQAPDSTELAEFAAKMDVAAAAAFESRSEGKCVLCGLCVRVCKDMMGRGVISMFGRGAARKVRTAFGELTDQCQACGACVKVCPTGAVDLAGITARRPHQHLTSHDQYLCARPSIDMAHPQAAPRVPAIDRDNCVHFKTGACGLCSKVCQAGAINYDQQGQTLDLDVGAVLLTPGFQAFDATRRMEFGFAMTPNVVSNVQFERLLSASGPTAGHIRRPSDDKAPKRLAFIQCIGSRDPSRQQAYCSSVCCMAATKEAIMAKEHELELDVTIFYMDMRAFGKDFERYYNRAKELGIRYIRCRPAAVAEVRPTAGLRITYIDEDNRCQENEFDMVVLSLGLSPSASLREQAERFGIMLNEWGFARTDELHPLDTSRAGVFVGGVFQEPKDIPDTVMQASAAAARAMSLLAAARGTNVRTKTYPPQRDVTDEPARIGVFICHCGSNIASVVDVEEVVRRTRALPGVVLAEHNVYTCADDTQDTIKDRIIEHRLNRVIVASCTPRTHEAIFRDTLRDAGLNPYLLEMANIRDQCSWVHSGKPDLATRKASDLVRMAVGRTANLMPLSEETVPVKGSAVVIGGGVAGMTAALALAEQGFPVHLVEKTAALGGTALDVYYTLDGLDVRAFLAELADRVTRHARITVYLKSRVTKVEGHVGDFKSEIVTGDKARSVEHGVVVVATGAAEGKPTTFGYGQSDRVLTQMELSSRLGRDELNLPERATIVMLQCVEQRNDDRPYCSRVCCTTAVKNALRLREKYPHARIVVLYRDMRTYGFREIAYQKARASGVLFIRFEAEAPPAFSLGADGTIDLTVRDSILARDVVMKPDLLILAAPIIGQADRQGISDLLRVPLNADGFFLEAHVKLRPVDFASEGLFLCGTAHAPKFIGEAVSQANAVAARAASILSRKAMPVGAQIACVDNDKCVGCMTCMHVCPYMAPKVGQDNKAQIQPTVCMGCGSCTSECPAKAITLRNYIDTQILGAIERLLGGDLAGTLASQPSYPEQVGVARPRWTKG